MEVRETKVVEIWYEKNECSIATRPQEVLDYLDKGYSLQVEEQFKSGQEYYKLQKTKPEPNN